MKIPAGEFKAKCLELMDKVQKTREEITITKHGHPVARLVPVPKAKRKSTLGCMRGTFDIVGDIMAPIDVEWEANK